MGNFSSEYYCKLDAKGRLVLPAKLKAALPETYGNELVMRRGFDPCLVLYPMSEYRKLDAKVSALDDFDPKQRNFKRSFYRGNTEVELDTTGRFSIPKPLLHFAEITKEVVVVGMGKTIEIWNPQKYDDFLIGDSEVFAEQAREYLSDSKK
ncbi:division/cell wall cluster transcriptional repressor MraZ [Echinicola sp. CAU 1574]|uniref:Transcriptional regulator MraZ n=1 Tax=Echinicola arenosa TaxID=2774144 RepID=A0ABR9AN42_9BACT|nr:MULTISPECIES: division/cell wall cluster transcriptional repressor MraZ [Echinicola]MBD8490200.1 division/cell wall cluster transcriptional repressor MraZ [Echinicola arenosa]